MKGVKAPVNFLTLFTRGSNTFLALSHGSAIKNKCLQVFELDFLSDRMGILGHALPDSERYYEDHRR